MALYSYKGNKPTELPNRIQLSNGFTKTDKATFTDEEIANAGYIEVDSPPQVEYPNKVQWNGTTISWDIIEPNDYMINTQREWIREECKRKLAETDYKVIKSLESGQSLDPIYVQYRQDLRDFYNNVENLEDIWNVNFPYPIFPEPDMPAIEEI